MEVVIEVLQENVVVQTEVVTHAIIGIPGTPGAPGAGTTFIHEQAMPATTWTINHGLNRYPSVTVADSAGTKVYGSVVYTSPNQVVLSFLSPFSGFAYLN